MLTVYVDVPPPETDPSATTTVAGAPAADIPHDSNDGFPVGLAVVIAIVVAMAVLVLVLRRRGRA